MESAHLTQIEGLCQKVFAGHQHERKAAGRQLVAMTQSTDFIPKCQFILENSHHSYTLMVAGKSLCELVTKHWNQFDKKQRIDIRNYVLDLLQRRGSTMEHFVSIHLIKLVCRITKLGWWTDQRHRDLVKELTKFLQHTIEMCIIGLKILNELVLDMNNPLPNETPTQLRKAAVSFKDNCLFHIFQVALTTMRQIHEKQIKGMLPDQADNMKTQALNLGINVLAFDFIGTNPDESSAEVGTIQVPLAWRPVVQDPATMQLLFDFFSDNKPPHSAKCLELLLYFASVRRSIFSSDTERKNFLARLMEGIRNILVLRQGIMQPDNYHQFCRLLSKLKSNYQLSDLVHTEGYQRWIELTTRFTVESFKHYKWSATSTHYLLQLWDRLVSATPYVKTSATSGGHRLDDFMPQVIEAYINGRLQAIQAAHTTQTVEDPLENPDIRESQLQHVPKMARYQYPKVAEIVVRKVDMLLAQYREGLQMPWPYNPQVAIRMKVLEGQLSFMVYICAALIGGQIAMLNRQRLCDGPGEEVTDAELCRRMFELIHMVEERLTASRGVAKASEQLELALLEFMQSFRKAYVGQHKGMPALPPISSDDSAKVMPTAITQKQKAYLRMFEHMKLGEYPVVINQMITKLGNNLKHHGASDEIITDSLTLFSNFVTGYSSGRLLLRLDTVQYILRHHTPDHFPFLVASAGNVRHRSLFHKTLVHLIWIHDGPAKFDEFMVPFINLLQNLSTVNLREEKASKALIGVCRDLRGIASATHNNRTYGMLFDCLYPTAFPALVRGAESCADMPEVMTAILKFMIEFVENKVQRIQFDHCSANGILLFRETSKIACAYASRALAVNVATLDKSNIYKLRYKGISLLLNMLSRILGGRYVNFGVFELYNDKALANALKASLQLAISIPLDELLVYPKVAMAYFQFVEVLFRNHLDALVQFDHAVLMQLITALQNGLAALDNTVSSRCAAALDHIATFCFRIGLRKATAAANAIRNHIAQEPQLFATLLGLLFNVVLFTNNGLTNQWSLGKPILSLMLASDEAFQECRKQLIATQPPENVPKLEASFKKLVHEIRPNLEQANRDRFSQRLNIFRREVMSYLKV